MTPMTTTDTAELLLALPGATPGDQSVSPWVQLLPFVFVLGIFYFIILLPMKRKQKKVQQFLEALKVGDRVITTGGIFGVITKLSDKSVQLQIADKVRIDVSKAAIGGYQGQEPVVVENPQ
jgi:preprotein translocase subunit YajC